MVRFLFKSLQSWLIVITGGLFCCLGWIKWIFWRLRVNKGAYIYFEIGWVHRNYTLLISLHLSTFTLHVDCICSRVITLQDLWLFRHIRRLLFLFDFYFFGAKIFTVCIIVQIWRVFFRPLCSGLLHQRIEHFFLLSSPINCIYLRRFTKLVPLFYSA